ncbi:MAG: mevalonate kinase family protein [Candidatus Sericytochromatia bacterium]
MNTRGIRVPGKLLLAGEYAIVEPGALALGLAVDRYLSLHAKPGAWRFENRVSGESWDYHAGHAAPPQWAYAAQALTWGLDYLGAAAPAGLVLSFESQLEGAVGVQQRKLGLGSSAAVTVAVLALLLQTCGHDISQPDNRAKLYRLAVLAHRQVQGSGSGADIACCIYGSVTAYTSPDFARLPLRSPLQVLIDKADWPLLRLEKLVWPADWPLYVGWTARPAATYSALEDYQEWAERSPDALARFLFDTQATVLGLREALLGADLPAFATGLSRARRALLRLGADLPEPLETPALQALIAAAETLGGAGKFSGAGRGDCGLAWVPAGQESALFQAWRSAGIEPLPLGLDFQGVCPL